MVHINTWKLSLPPQFSTLACRNYLELICSIFADTVTKPNVEEFRKTKSIIFSKNIQAVTFKLNRKHNRN